MVMDIIKIKIDDCDVYLEDFELGKGKIIITTGYDAYSSYWGSMGSNLSDFLCSINEYYFAGNLTNNMFEFSGKQTLKNIRKHLRESYDLPWYVHMETQKELRETLKEIEHYESANSFVSFFPSIINNLICSDMDYNDEKEFKLLLSDMFCEPWNFIGEKETNEYLFLTKFHGKLKKELLK